LKTRVRATSIEAYRDLKDLGDRQRQVLNALTFRDMSNLEISKVLGLPINAITPRVKELRDLGLVVEAGRKRCPYTGRSVTVWARVKDEDIGKNLSLFPAHREEFRQDPG
jgi:predicted transcriptional regulator